MSIVRLDIGCVAVVSFPREWKHMKAWGKKIGRKDRKRRQQTADILPNAPPILLNGFASTIT